MFNVKLRKGGPPETTIACWLSWGQQSGSGSESYDVFEPRSQTKFGTLAFPADFTLNQFAILGSPTGNTLGAASSQRQVLTDLPNFTKEYMRWAAASTGT